MKPTGEETFIYDGFLISVLLKGLISLIEVVSGIAAFLIPPATIIAIATFVLNYLPIASLQNALMQEVARYTSGAVAYVGIYLLSRGLIKVALVVGLLRNWLVAYPASLVVLFLFLLYQGYQIATTHSLIVTLISLFDIVVMYFIYREWRIVLAHRAAPGLSTPPPSQQS